MEALLKWSETLGDRSSFGGDLLISFGWMVVNLLKMLLDLVQSLLDAVFGMFDWITYAIQHVIPEADYKILIPALLAVGVFMVGFQLLWDPKRKKPRVLHQLLVFLVMVFGLSSLMAATNSMVQAAYAYFCGESSVSANAIISAGTIDWKYVDSNGFSNYEPSSSGNSISSPKGYSANGFTGENAANIAYIDPTEKITSDDAKGMESKELFTKVLTTGSDGSVSVKEIEKNKFFGMDFSSWRYRYKIDFIGTIITLLAMAIAQLFISAKAAKNIFDLAFAAVAAVGVSAVDMASGKKTKVIIDSIIELYATLIFYCILLKMLGLAQSFIALKADGLIAAILLCFLAWAVIDGPKWVERLVNNDLGVTSGFRTLAALWMGGKAAGHAVHSAASGVSSVAGGAVGAAVAGGKQYRSAIETATAAAAASDKTSDRSTAEKPSVTQKTDGSVPSAGSTTVKGGSAVGGDQYLQQSQQTSESQSMHTSGDTVSTQVNDGMASATDLATAEAMSQEDERRVDSEGRDLTSQEPEEGMHRYPLEVEQGEGAMGHEVEKRPMSALGTSSALNKKLGELQRPERRAGQVADRLSRGRGIIGSTVRGYQTGQAIGGAVGRAAAEHKIKKGEKQRRKKEGRQ